MRGIRITAVALAGMLALAACGEVANNGTTGLEEAAPSASEAAQLAQEVETEMTALVDQIQSSEAAADLQAAWSEMQLQLTTAIASIQAQETVDTTALQQELDDFQTQLDTLGTEVNDELLQAWENLRNTVEQIIA